MKKLLAVLLTAVLLLCLVPFGAGAAAKSYLVLGDSIGYGAGIRNPGEACYGKIIANTNGFSYKNNAVNGDRSADLRSKLTRAGFRSDVAAADIISISIGGNDFLRSNFAGLIAEGSSGNYGQMDEIVAGFNENLDAIMQTIRELNPNATVLFQTLYNPAPTESLKAVYAQALQRLNGAIEAYAQAHPGVYDIVDAASYVNAKTGQIAADNIHPNAAGNITIAQAVQDKLAELGLASTTTLVIDPQPQNHGQNVFAGIFAKLRAFFAKIAEFFRGLFR